MSDKRMQLINTALPLFYQKGIHAVGINEVLAEAKVAKKTLYNHFTSKEQLIQACVLERDKRFMHWLTESTSGTTSAENFIEALFDALDHWVNSRVKSLGSFAGCFFVNTAAEYSQHNCTIYQLCTEHKQQVKSYIFNQLKHYITDNKQLEKLVELLCLLKEGAINGAHVMKDMQAAQQAKQLALTYLK